MINWDRVRELREEVGSEDFEEVVHLFLEEVDDAILRLEAGADPDSLAADLHFLRGSALSLGFASFSDICRSVERSAACAAQDINSIIDSYSASKQEFLSGLPQALAA